MTRWPWRRWALAAAALLISLLVAPTAVEANMAAPWQPGDPLGEPSGAVRAVAIEHEALAFDLRALAADGPALVDATYHLRNEGPAQTLDLVFVAAALASRAAGATDNGHHVWLDDQAVPSTATTLNTLPVTWQPPKTTPSIAGDPTSDAGAPGLPYQTHRPPNRAISFRIALPSGQHTVRVTYQAAPSLYSGAVPTKYWQLGYVLAPARQWASFGGLDVMVQLPPGWAAAGSPPLARHGDELSGSFAALPADTLGLTVRAPAPRTVDIPALGWLAAVLALAAAALAGRRLDRQRGDHGWTLGLATLALLGWLLVVIAVAVILARRAPPLVLDVTPLAWLGGLCTALAAGAAAGRWLAQRQLPALWATPLAMVVGLLWLIAVLVAYTFSLLKPRVAGPQVAWDYAYGAGQVSIALALVAFAAGVFITQGTVFIARHRTHVGRSPAATGSTGSV